MPSQALIAPKTPPAGATFLYAVLPLMWLGEFVYNGVDPTFNSPDMRPNGQYLFLQSLEDARWMAKQELRGRWQNTTLVIVKVVVFSSSLVKEVGVPPEGLREARLKLGDTLEQIPKDSFDLYGVELIR